MSFEPPPLPQPVPVHCGDFVVPVVRNRTPLCFDLPVKIDARRLIFESIVGGSGGGGGGGGSGGGGWGGGGGSGGGGWGGGAGAAGGVGAAGGSEGGGGAGAGGVQWVAPALSLSGRIQCYRWQ